MNKLRILFTSICTAALLFIAISALAQVPPPPPDGHGQTGNREPGAPIDGGLGILLAMGAGYGGYKAYKARKKALTVDESENDE